MLIEKEFHIFINYRMSDTYEAAENLKASILLAFENITVFKDTHDLSPGDILPEVIKENITKCDLLLILIDDNWLNHKHPKFSKLNRLLYEHDWVRQELELAISLKKWIIPVLYGKSELLSLEECEKNLPPSLHFLKRENIAAHKIRAISPEEDKIKLFKHLEKKFGLTSKIDLNKTSNLYFKKTPILSLLENLYPLPKSIKRSLPSSPFIGLKQFTESDCHIFYGRSEEIFELCYKIDKKDDLKIILLEGYSGTGKSSLLYAGVIPRLKNKGWNTLYIRRENGLLSEINLLLEKKENLSSKRTLIILDQIEEIYTNGLTLDHELEDVLKLIINIQNTYKYLKFILSFRSEYYTRIQHKIDSLDIEYNRMYLMPLSLKGAVEAITSVSQDEVINRNYNLVFEEESIPIKIAETLIGSKDSFYIAPLLQVNMSILWEKAKKVKKGNNNIIRWSFFESDSLLLAEYDAIIDYYFDQIGKTSLPVKYDKKLILQILDKFIEDEPTAATRPNQEVAQIESQNPTTQNIIYKLKQLYLLSDIENGNAVRLTHDILAKVIRPKYKSLLEEENIRLVEQNFESLKKKFEDDILTLSYTEAYETLQKLLEINVRSEELIQYFCELLYFWHEVSNFEMVKIIYNLLKVTYQNSKNYEIFYKEGYTGNVIKLIKEFDEKMYIYLQDKYYPKLVLVEGGLFKMGATKSSNEEEPRKAEFPIHDVKLDTFSISETPITFWQFNLFCYNQNINLSKYITGWGYVGNNPATKICWYDAIGYSNWLSWKLRREVIYDVDFQYDPIELHGKKINWNKITDFSKNGFRLPTEAEWEYAARGGKLGISNNYLYAGGDFIDEVAWYDQNSMNRTQPVKLKLPNELGLYDMSGNVREWCFDNYSASFYNTTPVYNPTGIRKNESKYKVLRGGSHIVVPYGCRVSNRDFNFPNYRYNYYGFRVVSRD